MSATDAMLPSPGSLPDMTELMLHRAPMLLLDRIVAHEPGRLIAEVNVAVGKTFFEPALAGVPSWVGIEYMAQAIAAMSGLEQHATNTPIALGMLVSCRRYVVTTPVFSAGMALQVAVEELAGADTGMAAYQCAITAENIGAEELATGQLGVYLRSGVSTD